MIDEDVCYDPYQGEMDQHSDLYSVPDCKALCSINPKCNGYTTTADKCYINDGRMVNKVSDANYVLYIKVPCGKSIILSIRVDFLF